MSSLVERAYDAHRASAERGDRARMEDLRRSLADLLANGLSKIEGIEQAACIEVVSFTDYGWITAFVRVDGELVKLYKDKNDYHPGYHASLLSACMHCGDLVEVDAYSVSLEKLGESAARVACEPCRLKELPDPRSLLGPLPLPLPSSEKRGRFDPKALLAALGQSPAGNQIDDAQRPVALPNHRAAIAASSTGPALLPGYGQDAEDGG